MGRETKKEGRKMRCNGIFFFIDDYLCLDFTRAFWHLSTGRDSRMNFTLCSLFRFFSLYFPLLYNFFRFYSMFLVYLAWGMACKSAFQFYEKKS